MATHLCIDASFALSLLLPDEPSSQVENLWRMWSVEGTVLHAPPLFFAEVTSILRAKVYDGKITPDQGDAIFEQFQRLAPPVQENSPENLQQLAWDLAKRYNLRKAYDAQYLAVAKSLGYELWTVDERLTNSVPVTWIKRPSP